MVKPAEKAEALLERASAAQLRKLIVPGADEAVAAQALKILTQAPRADADALCAEIVTDRRFGPSVRSAAAVELGKTAKAENEVALVKALASPEPDVLRHVLNALGRIGGAKALDRLAGFEAPVTPGLPEALRFARSLIAYRLGSARFLIGPPATSELRPPPPETAFPLAVRAFEPKRLEPMLEKLGRQLPAIAPGARNALSVRCGASEYRVLLSGDADAVDAPSLLARPFIAGAIFKYRACSDRFSLDAYLFSSPRDAGSSHIFGVRPSGVMVLAGTAEIEKRTIGFEVVTTRSPHFRKLRMRGEVTQTGRFRALEAEGAREIADDGPRRQPNRLPLRAIDLDEDEAARIESAL